MGRISGKQFLLMTLLTTMSSFASLELVAEEIPDDIKLLIGAVSQIEDAEKRRSFVMSESKKVKFSEEAVCGLVQVLLSDKREAHRHACRLALFAGRTFWSDRSTTLVYGGLESGSLSLSEFCSMWAWVPSGQRVVPSNKVISIFLDAYAKRDDSVPLDKFLVVLFSIGKEGGTPRREVAQIAEDIIADSAGLFSGYHRYCAREFLGLPRDPRDVFQP